MLARRESVLKAQAETEDAAARFRRGLLACRAALCSGDDKALAAALAELVRAQPVAKLALEAHEVEQLRLQEREASHRALLGQV